MEQKIIGQYQLGECIGKGGFGSVFKGLNRETGETVAIKQVKLSDIPKSEVNFIMYEIDLLKNLNHPNIVKYYGFNKTKDYLFIIMEFCENGSLQTTLKKFGEINENLIAVYIYQMLEGLIYLHEQGVMHRDIKAANIMTTKEGHVKLGDFGVAAKLADVSKENNVAGSPYWMAPEVIEMEAVGTVSDIWSLGITIIELLQGKPPYYELNPMGALFKIVQEEHPPLPEKISPMLKDFLLQCLQKDTRLRISAAKLIKHAWLGPIRAKRTLKPAQQEIIQKTSDMMSHLTNKIEKLDLGKYIETPETEDYDFVPENFQFKLQLKPMMEELFSDEEEEVETHSQIDEATRNQIELKELFDKMKSTLKIDQQIVICQRICDLLKEEKEKQFTISSQNLTNIFELLENKNYPELIFQLLSVLNLCLKNRNELLDPVCLLGIHNILQLYENRCDIKIRLELAKFIKTIYQSKEHVKILAYCNGAQVLSQYLKEKYSENEELVQTGLEGIFKLLQAMTGQKSDFCLILIKYGALNSIVRCLQDILVLEMDSDPLITMIIEILYTFSRSSNEVREAFGNRRVLKGIFSEFEHLSNIQKLGFLKCLKNVSTIPSVLDTLQAIKAPKYLLPLLAYQDGKVLKKIRQQAFILFNYCRINKIRQELAAKSGTIPHLQKNQ